MGNASVQRGLFLTFRGFPSSVRAFGPATFPVGEGCLPAGEHSSGAGLNFQGSPPHPARATPGPPSPSRRGLEPLIRHALRRATFPVGEGDLPAGEHSSGAGLNFQGSPPHPARATPGPPSPSRRGQEPLIRQGLWPCHLPRRGRRPPGGGCIHGARSLSVGVPSASKLVPPLFRRCGGTFPQGKVREPAGAAFLWFTPGSGTHWDSDR